MKMSLRVVCVVLVVAVVCGVGSGFAAYVMRSESVLVTVSAAQTLGLSGSSAVLVQGEVLVLSASVSDQRNGIVVTFYDNGTNVGQATSMGGGYASLTLTPAVGVHNFTAVGLHP